MDDKEKIEKIMQIEKLNSVQFAAEIGIQGSTLSHILNGRNKPSLEVLKKILNRFRTINSDWLILDTGTMYRQEKHSQSPLLFPYDDESTSDSVFSPIKSDNILKPNISQKKIENPTIEMNSVSSIDFTNIESPKSEIKIKSVEKIIVYYTDNTFQEFITK